MTMERLREIAEAACKQEDALTELQDLPRRKAMNREEAKQHWIDTMVHSRIRNALNDRLRAGCAEYADGLLDKVQSPSVAG